jgi:hypothetical protein
MPTLRMGDLVRDHRLMEEARREAAAWLDRGSEAHATIELVGATWARRFGLVGVG